MISVTEVLDAFTPPELLAWYKRVGFQKAETISEEALRVGKLVDSWIQLEVQDRLTASVQTQMPVLLRLKPRMSPGSPEACCWQAWLRFKDEHPRFLATISGVQTEVTDGEIVGHPDLEVTEATRWGIVDIKTSRSIQPRHWTQVVAYADLTGAREGLISRSSGRRCGGNSSSRFVAILRLDKQTSQYEYREIADEETLRQERAVFRAYLTVYRHGEAMRETMRRQLEEERLDVA